jgi:hypothetical protein
MASSKITRSSREEIMAEDFAWPSTALLKLWREWIDLHSVLDKGIPGSIAAPFFSAACSQDCPNRILVVGKATDKDWWLGEYKKLCKSPDQAVRSRLGHNREFVRRGGNRSAFWRLFDRLAELSPEPDSCSLIWSNIAKIGALKGNPKGVLLSAQKYLAERTLRAEIEEYRPALVVFATGSYAGDVIERVCGGSDWKQSSTDNELWWRQGVPAMLGTRHPQGVTMDKIDFWIKKAGALVGARSNS